MKVNKLIIGSNRFSKTNNQFSKKNDISIPTFNHSKMLSASNSSF